MKLTFAIIVLFFCSCSNYKRIKKLDKHVIRNIPTDSTRSCYISPLQILDYRLSKAKQIYGLPLHYQKNAISRMNLLNDYLDSTEIQLFRIKENDTLYMFEAVLHVNSDEYYFHIKNKNESISIYQKKEDDVRIDQAVNLYDVGNFEKVGFTNYWRDEGGAMYMYTRIYRKKKSLIIECSQLW